MIYETKIVTNGDLRYQVQVRQRIDGVIQQRHIWYRGIFGEIDPPEVEPWIYAPTKRLDLWASGMTPSTDYRDEIEEAILALEEIAAGHNDARSRARSALQAIRSQTP